MLDWSVFASALLYLFYSILPPSYSQTVSDPEPHTFPAPLEDKRPLVKYNYSYTSNPAANLTGGLSSGATYTDNHLFGMSLHFPDLVSVKNPKFDFSFLDRNGQSLSKLRIGNQFTVQQIYGGQTFIYYNLTFSGSIPSVKTDFRMGRMGAGDVFATDPIYWLYMNNAICGVPQSLPVNTGFSTYPTAVWGAAATTHVSPRFSVGLGAFQVPDFNLASTHGLNWSIHSSDGLLLVMQLGLKSLSLSSSTAPNQSYQSIQPGSSANGNALVSSNSASSGTDLASGLKSKNLPWNTFLGSYLSLTRSDGFGESPGSSSTYGFYWHFDHQITSPKPGSDAGLKTWFSATLSPQSNVAKLPAQLNAGLIYKGLLNDRPNDLILLGFFTGIFSNDYLSSTSAANGLSSVSMPGYESVVELDYRYYVYGTGFVQPSLQIVLNPGGTGTISNSLVLGAQIGFSF